jgi:hypothetical protein
MYIYIYIDKQPLGFWPYGHQQKDRCRGVSVACHHVDCHHCDFAVLESYLITYALKIKIKNKKLKKGHLVPTIHRLLYVGDGFFFDLLRLSP